MNCSRAVCSSASWRCMRSKAAARRPEFVERVDLDPGGEVTLGDTSGGALEPADASGERTRDQVTGEHREAEGDESAQQDPRADEVDVGVNRLEVVEEDGDLVDLAPHLQRDRDLGHSTAGRRLRARLHLPGAHGDVGEDEGCLSSSSSSQPRLAVRLRPSEPDETSSSTTRAPERTAARASRTQRIDDRHVLSDRGPQRFDLVARRRLQRIDLLLTQLTLERRQHEQVGGEDRAGDDQPEQRGQSVAQRPRGSSQQGPPTGRRGGLMSPVHP